MEQTFRYKAFISYRHTERDKKIAVKLQKKLESYKPPKGIASEEKWKIFRDETELSSNANLSIKIKEALDTANAELENKNNALDKSNTELANTNKELDSANSELEKSNAEHRQRRADGGKLRTHLLRGIRPSGRDRRTAEHTPVPRGLLSSASVSETLSQQSAVQLLRNRYAKAPARARYRKHDRGLQSIVAYDARNTYVFDVATGELIVRNLPSAVTQIGYRGTSGWVSVYTSQGAQYHYNILTDYSILGNVLTDSSVFSADGSRKLVWVSNNLSAALGKQSNRIMVYFSEESQAASTIPGDGNGFSRVTEGNDCIYSVSKTKLFVHDKNTKKERFRFNIDYSMGPSVVCRDSLYVLDNDADYIHIYNGENGEEYYINISGLSRYSVHYQHHTKI